MLTVETRFVALRGGVLQRVQTAPDYLPSAGLEVIRSSRMPDLSAALCRSTNGHRLANAEVVGPTFSGAVGPIDGVEAVVEATDDVTTSAGVEFVQAVSPETPSASAHETIDA